MKKTFFSPIEGGVLDGYTFKEFLKSPQRWLIPLIWAIFTMAIIYHKDEFESVIGLLVSLGFMSLILVVFVFKTLQHWSDLKQHKSR
jgi:hypothetical protein